MSTIVPVDDYVTFCEGVARLCGLDLSRYKRNQMERRIRTQAERRGFTDLDDYLLQLRRDPQELDRFLDRVTINVSSLWRSPEQWTRIADDLAPRLATAGRIRIWSAGCSIGAEAYTAAAVVRDAVPNVRVEVLGTDIDRRVLDAARAGGPFADTAAQAAPRDALERHFDRSDEGWTANAALRRGVRFEPADLLTSPVRRAAFDLILCRNTVIYFNAADRDAVHARLAQALRPGGYLVIGPTERVADPTAIGLTTDGPFVYRRD
ncbi:MAG: protein-glutamate O-methyltransferase CheR [Solirubrobacteraceae bacterium]|nr:protein-glutamate O-methyltransferase CheR [Solirubrobacteraceae bacterium]